MSSGCVNARPSVRAHGPLPVVARLDIGWAAPNPAIVASVSATPFASVFLMSKPSTGMRPASCVRHARRWLTRGASGIPRDPCCKVFACPLGIERLKWNLPMAGAVLSQAPKARAPFAPGRAPCCMRFMGLLFAVISFSCLIALRQCWAARYAEPGWQKCRRNHPCARRNASTERAAFPKKTAQAKIPTLALFCAALAG